MIAQLLAWIFVLLPTASLGADDSVQALIDAGQINRAVPALEARLKASTTDAEAWNLLCRCRLSFGENDSAVAACEKAVALEGKNAKYHLWLARAYGEQASNAGMLRAAQLAVKSRREFERSVELDNRDIDARADLASFYIQAPGFIGGSLRAAREQADAIAGLDAALAHSIRGRIAEAEHDQAAAEKEYLAATAAAPSSAAAWQALAAWNLRVGHDSDLKAALEKLLEATITDTTGARVDAAQLLIGANRDLPTAAELLHRYLSSRTVESAPAFVAHTALGTILEKQGDRAKAIVEYRAAVDMAPEYKPAKDALTRLTR